MPKFLHDLPQKYLFSRILGHTLLPTSHTPIGRRVLAVLCHNLHLKLTALFDRQPVIFPYIDCLKAPERVQYKLETIVYRSLNGMAPHYLAADLRRLSNSNMPSRRRLRSSLTRQQRWVKYSKVQVQVQVQVPLPYNPVQVQVRKLEFKKIAF